MGGSRGGCGITQTGSPRRGHGGDDLSGQLRRGEDRHSRMETQHGAVPTSGPCILLKPRADVVILNLAPRCSCPELLAQVPAPSLPVPHHQPRGSSPCSSRRAVGQRGAAPQDAACPRTPVLQPGTPGELGQEPSRALPAAAATAGGGQSPGTKPQAMQRPCVPRPTTSPPRWAHLDDGFGAHHLQDLPTAAGAVGQHEVHDFSVLGKL